MRTNLKAICLAGSIGVALGGVGCSTSTTPKGEATGGNVALNSGGQTGVGGSSASTSAGTSGTSDSSSTGGATGNGDTSNTKAATGGKSSGTGGSRAATGGTRTTSANTGGSASNTGGAANAGASSSAGTGTVGGTTSTVGGNSAGGSGGASVTGSGGPIGGVTSIGGSTGTGGVTSTGGSSVDYMLPPPDQCHDVDYQPWTSDPTTGCVSGNTSSKCGGKCQTASVCEDTSSKPGADVEYMCPRDMLFSPEMEQAVKDDGYEGFHYAVVGHDPDQGGIDGNAHTCCQCYQLVYAYPSPNNDRQAQINPDTLNPLGSAITVPPPLIVQSFNTAATATTFDVYMPAGGMGANNGCYPMSGSPSAGSKEYMYTGYPTDGQPGNGGVKPASLYTECKTQVQWVTDESLEQSACVSKTKAACEKITSNIPGLTKQASEGCLAANSTASFYHLNWSVYAMRVECPEHLTRVTGCRLQPQGLKSPKKDVTTAAQAAKDPDFWSKTAHTNNLYETTTMEDCCRPTCASYSQISNFGLKTDPDYRSFYNCDSKGVPWTQPE